MAAQRDMITRAAWECFMEKGLANTTVRDVCVRAGISMGALYHHFRDRTELVVQARLAHYEDDYGPTATSWAEYIEAIRRMPQEMRNPQAVKRARLSYEFLAEFTELEESPPEVGRIIDNILKQFLGPLAAAHAAGDISLPLGLERTAELHVRLVLGTQQKMFVDRRRDPAADVEDLVRGLSLLAGAKEF